MKKSTLIIFALVSICMSAIAQDKAFKKIKRVAATKTNAAPPSNYYSFSTFTASYQNIAGTLVSGGLKWDDLDYKIPIGFNFKLYNDQNDTLAFWEGCFMTFNDYVNDPLITLASPIYEDLCDRALNPNNDYENDPGGLSPISYTTIGIAGSRICKIEVKDAGFFGENEQNGTAVSFVNFQLWLYEGSNDIEFRYGNMSILNPAINLQNGNGFLCGLVDNLNFNNASTLNSNVLNGNYNNPAMVALSTNATEVVMGNPENGRVYKFSTPVINTTAIADIFNTRQIKMYPNPAKDKLFIGNVSAELGNGNIEFYDVAGKLIHSEKLTGIINLSSINRGIYLVKIKTENGEPVFINKLVIAD